MEHPLTLEVHEWPAGNAEGAYPRVALVLGADGWMYGGTGVCISNPAGGDDPECDADHGTIYKVSTSGEFVVLQHFKAGETDLAGPDSTAMVQDTAGNVTISSVT